MTWARPFRVKSGTRILPALVVVGGVTLYACSPERPPSSPELRVQQGGLRGRLSMSVPDDTRQRDGRPQNSPADSVAGLGGASGSGEPAAAGSERKAAILYLHGRIVQEQGPDAVSEEWGPYQFQQIVAQLGAQGATVRAPLRAKGQELQSAVSDTLHHVRDLLREGFPAASITIVGASQGALIAMLVSQELGDPELKLVLMGACNAWVRDEVSPDLHGAVLSIYEQGDRYGGTCGAIMEQSSAVSRFEEVRLETGLGHGFLYRPIKAWLEPALDWTRGP